MDKEYWKERFSQLEQSRHDTSIEKAMEIQKEFDKAKHTIEDKINSWYTRLADNNGISLVEARKLLNAGELEEFKWDVDEYIEYGQKNAIDQQWMKELENASSRAHISRLEQIEMQCRDAYEKAFAKYDDSVRDYVQDVYSDGYYHTAYEIQKGTGKAKMLAGIDKNKLEKIINKPWAADGKNFSDRIWQNKSQLINNLHTSLTQMCITGEAPDKAINAIAKSMNTTKANAGRLIMTESAYFGTLSEHDCYKELDVEQYEILATLDSRTSSICQEMDGKVFKMSEFEPGVTAPPFHCNCRSDTIPYFNDEFTENGERAARDEDDNTYYVPSDMTYKQWEKAFVDGDKSVLDEVVGIEPIQSTDEKLTADFEPAKTIEEAQEYASQFMQKDFMDRTFKGIADYKGLSLDSANSVNRALNNIYSNLDIEKISGIKAISPNSAKGKKAFNSEENAIAAYDPIQHGIYLNKDILKSSESFEDYVKRSDDAWDYVMQNRDDLTGAQKALADQYAEAGRSLVDGKTIEGVITHEMGHHVQWSVLDAKTNNTIGDNMSKYASKISGYASASKGEYIAENFTAYVNGEKDIIAPQFVEFLDDKAVVKSAKSGTMELTRNRNSTHRKIGSEGQQIIDTPTYNKLTKKFIKNDGIIIRGEDAEIHLKQVGASASYLPSINVDFIKDDATVSDVLEEMYHAEQENNKAYSNLMYDEMNLRREIDAQKYLLSMTDKYNIPDEEVRVTKANLAMYEKKLTECKKRR